MTMIKTELLLTALGIALLASHAAMFGLGYLHARSIWRRGLPPSTRRELSRVGRIARKRAELPPNRMSNVRMRCVQELDEETAGVGPTPGGAA